LVPRTAGREPGLLLVSVDGALRFWDSIASSLSGSERYQSLDIALGAAESVINLQRCDSNTFVLATSQGRLFKITIYSSGGRLQANLTPFNQQRGIFGRLFGGGGATTSGFGMGSEGVIALAPSPALQGQGSRDLYAAGHRVIQKWRLVDSGGEKLIVEQDIGGLLAALVDGESEEGTNAADAISLEIIDAAAQR
jgi:nuclear pore complex protein Nup133